MLFKLNSIVRYCFISLVVTYLFNSDAIAQKSHNTWQGQGEAGFVKASGNTDSENLNLGLGFTKTGDIWSHEFKVNSYQASTNGDDTANNLAADYILKRSLSPRSNLFFNLGYLDDDFDGFTKQTSLSSGYGYKVIDNERVTWETGIGIGYRDTAAALKLDNGTEIEGNDLSGATLVLRSDYSHQFTDNTQFIDKFKADFGSDNSFIENDAALLVSMNDKFAIKLGLIIRHNTDPAIGADDTDTISTANLVYKFGQ